MENGILSPSSLNSLRGIKLFAPLPSIDFGLALDDCENISISLDQAAESALALWVAMKDSVSQMYDNRGLAEFWGPDV